MLNGKNILISGGSGTIGIVLTEYILTNYKPNVIRILSRDDTKQHFLMNKFKGYEKILRFFIGDIRDKERLFKAMEDINMVFHLAALKQVITRE